MTSAQNQMDAPRNGIFVTVAGNSLAVKRVGDAVVFQASQGEHGIPVLTEGLKLDKALAFAEAVRRAADEE